MEAEAVTQADRMTRGWNGCLSAVNAAAYRRITTLPAISLRGREVCTVSGKDGGAPPSRFETAYYPTVLTSGPHPAERDVGTRETSARGDPAPATRGVHVTESSTNPQAPPTKTLTEAFAPAQAPVSPEQPPTEVEFVQLLTPEGERVEHPDYSFDLDD